MKALTEKYRPWISELLNLEIKLRLTKKMKQMESILRKVVIVYIYFIMKIMLIVGQCSCYKRCNNKTINDELMKLAIYTCKVLKSLDSKYC